MDIIFLHAVLFYFGICDFSTSLYSVDKSTYFFYSTRGVMTLLHLGSRSHDLYGITHFPCLRRVHFVTPELPFTWPSDYTLSLTFTTLRLAFAFPSDHTTSTILRLVKYIPYHRSPFYLLFLTLHFSGYHEIGSLFVLPCDPAMVTPLRYARSYGSGCLAPSQLYTPDHMLSLQS